MNIVSPHFLLVAQEQASKAKEEFSETEFVILGAVLVGLTAVAVFLALKVRDLMYGANPSLGEHMTDFQAMADSGQLDGEELQRVRKAVKGEMRQQMSREEEESG